MTIRPVDLNGMVQRTQDVSTIKQNENNRPAIQQQNVSAIFEKKMEHQMHQVEQAQKESRREEKFDAREESHNKYQDNRKKQKKQQESQDRVVVKEKSRGFDVEI